MDNWLAALILGIVEGVTEFLPISSTGHLLLAEHWLPIQSPFLQSDLFTVIIQPAAVVAVLLLFWEKLLGLARDWQKPEARDYLLKLAVGFGLTVVGGYLLKKFGMRLPKTITPIALATLLGGVLFLVVERWLKNHKPGTELTWLIAIAVAVGQLLAAAFPGLSRSGATILVALALGLARPQATEFSFMMGLPTLMAAAVKELMDFHNAPPGFAIDWGLVLIGSVASAITAFLSVKWLLRFVQSHTFNGFGWYRIVLGGAVLLFAR
jgi:undecaprenyl-diphosphatase